MSRTVACFLKVTKLSKPASAGLTALSHVPLPLKQPPSNVSKICVLRTSSCPNPDRPILTSGEENVRGWRLRLVEKTNWPSTAAIFAIVFADTRSIHVCLYLRAWPLCQDDNAVSMRNDTNKTTDGCDRLWLNALRKSQGASD